MKRTYNRINENHNMDLHTDGYQIYKNVINVPIPIYHNIIRQTNKKEKPIFNHHETRSRNDYKRKQCNLSIKNKQIEEFITNINNFLTTNVNSNLSISQWVILHSLSGCGDQAAHCDYVPSTDMLQVSDDQIPLAVIVALMPSTKIHIWPQSCYKNKRNKKMKIEKLTLELEPGDVFVFRGDLVHAGCAYENDNYRLHTYMDSLLVSRTHNRTWLIDKHADDNMRKMIVI